MSAKLPEIGAYWSEGVLTTDKPMQQEWYATCARCGAFVNMKDRHEDWHRAVELAGDPR